MGEEEGSSDVMLCRPMSREVKAINTAFLPACFLLPEGTVHKIVVNGLSTIHPNKGCRHQ